MKKFSIYIALLVVGAVLGALLGPRCLLFFSIHEKKCANMNLVASYKDFALYASSNDEFILFRGTNPIVSELSSSDGWAERSLHSPYPSGPFFCEIICNFTFSKSGKNFAKVFYSLPLLESSHCQYVYRDTNGNGFFDQIAMMVDGVLVPRSLDTCGCPRVLDDVENHETLSQSENN